LTKNGLVICIVEMVQRRIGWSGIADNISSLLFVYVCMRSSREISCIFMVQTMLITHTI